MALKNSPAIQSESRKNNEGEEFQMQGRDQLFSTLSSTCLRRFQCYSNW
ncbi:hypothetical protein SLEP1_g52748 [Rubroshorea leprosula]|uniref:Uncharacterized protein n=1 Tax=Rubroshorea leprosula TaxID=152421 RepID=A0AAV5M814_9ROSI|nr:hypothetical protein SLEP1_g52748 [Rubroshorea leprosula]